MTATLADRIVADALEGAPPFLTCREVGARLGRAERTIRKDVAKGLINVVRIAGGHPRIARSELERVIREAIEE